MVRFHRRDDVEANNSYLQLIPIGVLTDKNHPKILVLKKQAAVSKNSAEKGSHLLWFGGHMREEDKIKGLSSFEDLAKITLKREVEEELGIAVAVPTRFVSFCKPPLCLAPRFFGDQSRIHILVPELIFLWYSPAVLTPKVSQRWLISVPV